MDGAPNVPWPDVPVQQFFDSGQRRRERKQDKNLVTSTRLSLNGSVNTFRLLRAVLEREKAVGTNLEKFFFRMGARVKVAEFALVRSGWRRVNSRGEDLRVVLNIGRDKLGKFFEIRTLAGTNQELLVLNADPRKKHLLLLSRQFDEQGKLQAKQKFLCGQDEGHWFVAAIPEDEAVSTVAAAQIALKPGEVRMREEAMGVTRKEGFRRKKRGLHPPGGMVFPPCA